MAKPKPLILIVEDDPELAQLISDQLEAAGMLTQVHHRAANVTRYLKSNFANLMLLDINLPDQTGFALIERLKTENIEIPIIFLTGKDNEADRVRGLEMGGDDYITKPFSFSELVARINAVLRRSETSKDTQVTKNVSTRTEPFTFEGAKVHPDRMEIDFPGKGAVKIGRKELGILSFLRENADTVITRRTLIHAVWGIHADVRSRSLDQYIVKVRTLFERHGIQLDAFKTIHGVGYIYNTRKQDSD
ncbi:MAG: response regulator [Verrucomicrobia bacterium]|jgi:two-component system alkaline phosphatase synthesis response regulator PhoP|nr:response regulator [Verrucomicrobiota bacterium]